MRTVKDNYWLDTPYEPSPALRAEIEADVAIIGGGFTGLAAAYFIKQRFPGKRVIVLESEYIGFGSSGRNSGGVSGIMGHNYLNLKKKYGIEKTVQLQRLISQGVPLVEELLEKHNIDCEYERTGRLVVAETESQNRLLEREKQAADEAGANVVWLGREEARSRFGGRDVLAAVRHPDEGIMNPAKFLRGMKRVVESLGSEVYEHSCCTHVETGPILSLYTPLGQIRARDIVVATNAYSNPLGLFRHRVLPFHLYQIVTEPLTQAQLDELHLPGRENTFLAKNLYWAMRLTTDNRVLFVQCDVLYFYDAERDHSHRPSEYRSYYKLLIEKFPFLEGIKMTHQWGGRIGITLDFLPRVGRTGKHDNIYYGLGYNGCGLAPGQLVGKILAALMAGESSELTNNMLINKPTWGVPSAFLTYLGAKGLLYFYKTSDRRLDMGR
jgi:gamma-glutamylputrescine oxidase